MDFNALCVFLNVVEHRGFHAAAMALHKTQPAVTNAIKKLEEQLNVVLFDRNHYRPVLTKAGEKLYRRAKILLNHWQHVEEFAENLTSEQETDITIAVDVFYPLEQLSSLLKRWLAQFPLTRFHLLSESLGGACERLLEHQADIIISENLISSVPVELIILTNTPMIAVASPDFIKEYDRMLADVDSLGATMQVILRDSSAADLNFGVVAQAHHWSVSDVIRKKEIIVAGLGWGRLPYHLISNELIDGRLCPLQGNHFDTRLLTLAAIRLQKPAHGPIAEVLWHDLQGCALVPSVFPLNKVRADSANPVS